MYSEWKTKVSILNMMKIGIGVTVAYLLALLTQIWYRLPSFYGLELNEVGDFLAGVLGPLSIFWLILSFKQQGDELKAQAAEMAHSVNEQKELVKVAAQQFMASIEALELQRKSVALQYAPKVIIESAIYYARGEEDFISLHAQNLGEHARNFSLIVDGEGIEAVAANSCALLDKNDNVVVEFKVLRNADFSLIKFYVRYEDMFGYWYSSVFSLSEMGGTNELEILIEERAALSKAQQ